MDLNSVIALHGDRSSEHLYTPSLCSSFLPYFKSNSGKVFHDDVTLRIIELNDSLNRIKAFGQESANNYRSLNTTVSFKLTELPTLFFD